MDLEKPIRRGVGLFLNLLDLETGGMREAGSYLILLDLSWLCRILPVPFRPADSCEKRGKNMPDPFGLGNGCKHRGRIPCLILLYLETAVRRGAGFYLILLDLEKAVRRRAEYLGDSCEERIMILPDPFRPGWLRGEGNILSDPSGL